MASDTKTEIVFSDSDNIGIYHSGLDIVAENGSYYIPSEIFVNDAEQPTWISPYEDYVFGHCIKLHFPDVEESETFYDWLLNLTEWEEHIPAYPDQSDFGRRISQLSPESVFLYIPGVGDICSAVIEEAVIDEDQVTLNLFLSVKGSGYDDIESVLPMLFG